MTDMGAAVGYLKQNGIEAVEGSGILVVPCHSPAEVMNLVGVVKRYLKDIGYEKSWQINPYYYEVKMKGDRDYEFDEE